MSADQDTIAADVLRSEIAQLADNWAGLGMWCTLWSDQGRLACPISERSLFWKTLWNKGQGFRNRIADAVRRGAEPGESESLLDIEGLRVRCLPLSASRREATPVTCHKSVVVCYVDKEFIWGEDFARLCSQWQLDERALHSWLEQQPRYNDDQATLAHALIRQALQAIFDQSNRQSELDEMTSQLTGLYEELNLIYRVGATMRVTQQPKEHFARLFEDLSKTTPYTTLAAILYDTDVLDPDNRLIIGGEQIIDEPGILKIADFLQPVINGSRNAMIINNVGDYPQLDWTAGWLERLVAVPIVCNHAMLGMVLVLNHGEDVDFDSTDVRLLHSVVDCSAIYFENVLLYGDLNKLLMGLLHALVNSIDAKDPYTCGHSNRVALISQRIAEKVGVSVHQAERVYLTGLLHDVGKIGVSEVILCKPARLTDAEQEEMRKHPAIGARILRGISQLDDVVPGVLYHHEWISGKGYPAGLSGDEIPWVAKVVGLADAFDAMTSGRNYRDPLPRSSAMAEIHRYAGTQFCPRLVDALFALVAEGLCDELKNVKEMPAFSSVYSRWNRSIEQQS